MKLAHLAEQIVKAAPSEMLTDQMIFASLDFRGPQNGHLAIPEWHSNEHRTWEMQRFEFLTGAEEIAGDILVFDYCDHDGKMWLRECKTLVEAGKRVLGRAGVFNVYTDLVLVFKHFRLRPYQVSYQDYSGTRVVFDRSHIKALKRYPNRQIAWLASAA
jgi:hypothetical protein